MSATTAIGLEREIEARKGEHQEFLSDVIMEAANTAGLDQTKLALLQKDRKELLGRLVVSLREYHKDYTIRNDRSSLRRYPNFTLRPLEDQIKSLRKRFPKLKENVAAISPLEETDGLFAIPNPIAIGDDYYDALAKVFAIILRDRGRQFNNEKSGFCTANRMLHHKRTEGAFNTIIDHQGDNDILVFPCQLGRAYVGDAPQDAITKMKSNEFPLNAYMAAIILMTHAQRLGRHKDLSLDASGDEFLCREEPRRQVATFSHVEGFLVFDSRAPIPSINFGTASGFIPA